MKLKLVCSLILILITRQLSGNEIEVSIVEFGEYEETSLTGKQDAKNTTLGSVNVIDPAKDPTLKKKALYIKGEMGKKFGIKFRVENASPGEIVPVTIRVVHPLIKKPGSTSASAIESWEMEGTAFVPRYTGWSFDESWEIVRGEWFIQVFHKGKRKAEQRFVIE